MKRKSLSTLILVSIVFLVLFFVAYRNLLLKDKEQPITQIKEALEFKNTDQQKDDSNGGYAMDKVDVYIEEDGRSIRFFTKNNEMIRQDGSNSDNLTSDGYRKSHLKIAPEKTKLGYFVDLNSLNSSDKETDYEKHTALMIIDVNGQNKKEIYRGSYHTSNWEWLNENEVVVYYGCGTECMVGFVTDTDSGQRKAELQYGVGYEWSPNRELVFAYHYWNYGITVGDKKGKELLSIFRHTTSYKDLSGETKSVWSPDSSKLALIIKKENKNQMELLVFDVTNNFKQIFRRDVDDADKYDLEWNGDSERMKLNNVEVKI